MSSSPSAQSPAQRCSAKQDKKCTLCFTPSNYFPITLVCHEIFPWKEKSQNLVTRGHFALKELIRAQCHLVSCILWTPDISNRSFHTKECTWFPVKNSGSVSFEHCCPFTWSSFCNILKTLRNFPCEQILTVYVFVAGHLHNVWENFTTNVEHVQIYSYLLSFLHEAHFVL